jgi:uncharacterized damage-inducible protein DinB
MTDSKLSLPEPWLRGTLAEVPPVARGVLHALELAREDLDKWCASLTYEQLHARPAGLPSVAFQLRHIAGSVDRLLTYAEGGALTEAQFQILRTEADSHDDTREIRAEVDQALWQAAERVRVLATKDYSEPRFVGTKQLPTTLGGLLVHLADHTQRHVGQAITMAKLVSAAKNL